jgi:hypothetical protein
MFDVANSVRPMNEEPSPDASRTVSRPDSQDTRDLCSPLPISPTGRDARASGSEGTGVGRGRGWREGIDPVRGLLFVR